MFFDPIVCLSLYLLSFSPAFFLLLKHALGWTEEQAFMYMKENTAMGEHDARTEVARYITWPGQATAYKVGERFIRKLRTLAETELGGLFDPRDFYDVVLLCGAVPLDVLEELVKDYIGKTVTKGKDQANSQNATEDLISTMTFINWCKCCTVPGTCQS